MAVNGPVGSVDDASARSREAVARIRLDSTSSTKARAEDAREGFETSHRCDRSHRAQYVRRRAEVTLSDFVHRSHPKRLRRAQIGRRTPSS